MKVQPVRLPRGLKPVDVPCLRRLGRLQDGGYLVSGRTIEDSDALLGLGVSDDWSFEKEFLGLKQPGFRIDCYDDRVSARKFFFRSINGALNSVVRPSREHFRRALLYPRYLAFFARNPNVRLFRERVGRDGKGETGLAAILERIAPATRVFAKIDIEGSEYLLMDDLLLFADSFSGFCIEFHEVDALQDRVCDFCEQAADRFVITHVHGNNMGGIGPSGLPNALECTFELRETLAGAVVDGGRSYPLAGLDYPNDPGLPDYGLEFF